VLPRRLGVLFLELDEEQAPLVERIGAAEAGEEGRPRALGGERLLLDPEAGVIGAPPPVERVEDRERRRQADGEPAGLAGREERVCELAEGVARREADAGPDLAADRRALQLGGLDAALGGAERGRFGQRGGFERGEVEVLRDV